MFYWMKRTSGGSETLDSLDNMSKAEILRGIVTEKLSTAAQEILAVVERTVAGYEEEAAGFRREIDRQRKQLELLLQPRVALERKALIPEEGGQEVVVLSEEEEEQHTQQSGVEDSAGLGFLWFDDEDDVEGDEEQQLSGSSRRKREDLKDPDFQITSRLTSPRARSDRRRPGRPRSSDTRRHLDLRVCFLEDPRTEVLSNSVFRKFPVRELKCPRGLPEADFLHLLRSTFPQLAEEKPFEVFTSDRSKRLQPLSVTALTPEEICSSIRLSGAGNSALYIRLKTAESSSEDQDPHRPDEAPSRSETPGRSSPRADSEKRRRGRPRLGEEPTHHLLRVCLLQDSEAGVPSDRGLNKSSVKDLRCPRGLREADFLELLRSAFPELAGDDRRFHVFKSDRSRRLQRLRVAPLTPEEIFRSVKSTGVTKTLLYIRPQTGEEEELPLQSDDVTAASPIKRDEAGLSSSAVQPVQGKVGCSSSAAADVEAEGDEEGAACSSEDGDDDWKPDPEQLAAMSARRRRGASVLQGKLAGGRKMPCKICGVWYRIQGSLIKHAWSHVDEPQGVCGVCGERFQSAEELKAHLKKYQKTHDCSYCAKSFLTVTGLKYHTTLHTGNRPFRCDVCSKTFAHMSSLSIHRWVHVDDKPYKCERCPKAFGLMAQLRAHSRLHAGRDKYLCNVCGKTVYDLRSLTRHKTTHSGERRFSCELCGKRFKLLNTLKSHEKTHTVRDRPYLCHICCKTFLSNNGLKAHIKTHSSERPFPCVICGKGFISNGELKAHLRVHTGEAPYGCSECGRFFKRKTHLNNHVRSHLGIKLFVCTVCGKACSRQEHLTVHMRTHNGERPYQCTFCDKAFTQSHCLKTHMKSHHGEESPFLDASSS